MSDVSTLHPDYSDMVPEWEEMRDAVRGETRIKRCGEIYLPRPTAFERTPIGDALYRMYQKRARFPEIVQPTVAGLAGTIHRLEAQIEGLPPSLEPLWERATPEGLPLESLHALITTEVLTAGRYGLLVGAPSEGADVPWIAGYNTEAIINWSDAGDFYVLDECGLVRDGFAWTPRKQYRVLELVEGVYQVRVFEGDNLVERNPIDVRARGSRALSAIPFVGIGPRFLTAKPESPPLIGVARSAVSIYQLNADYRWQLFMTGQETATFINCDAPDTVGSGITLELKNDNPEVTPDFKYVGPSGTGIEAHERAIAAERDVAASHGAKMFDTDAPAAESGEAKKIRYAAQTASLLTIANSSAKGLEAALRHAGRMQGLPDSTVEKIVVKPNLSFVNPRITSQEIGALVKAWQDRSISYETLYENLQRGDIASPERNAEAEWDLIQEEVDELDPILAGALDPNQPPPQPQPVPAPPGGGA